MNVDMDEMVVSTSARLKELAEQAGRLGTGLQNAAPGEQSGVQNPSIQYLQGSADMLNKSAKECLKLGPAHLQEPASKS